MLQEKAIRSHSLAPAPKCLWIDSVEEAEGVDWRGWAAMTSKKTMTEGSRRVKMWKREQQTEVGCCRSNPQNGAAQLRTKPTEAHVGLVR
ncbi:hypothetical protein O9K51_09176 [Purpureocillium lavendulum]|uniref:Uncharacterized protein n=1 Tax=Purpureocillium lavendulum TaxID=1247861 RepID=A0AB34FGJ8_9HYPO|nr:hypothetical protein O9K51_09176 [Purpureocillium lavendulum]